MKIRTRAVLALTALTALGLSACGSDSLSQPAGPAPAPSTSTASASADPALVAALPKKIADAGKIVVGTDASYAPNEFLDADGKTVIGFEVDLFKAVAARFGVTAEFQPSSFDTIIVGVGGGKYDVGVSSFTINDRRKQQVNMVSYFNAGTQWATKPGNPKQINPDDACGATVAVQTGTVQEQDDLPARQAKCGANKIDVLPFEGQDQATAAVASGRADAMLADSPIVAYAVQQSGGQLEALGDIYDAAPYGFVVPKDETAFAEALAKALQEAKADGSYEAALTTWGVQQGAISDFAVNP